MDSLNDYQNATERTAFYAEKIDDAMSTTDQADWHRWLCLSYAAGKLNGEAGEIAEEVFKALRDDEAKLTEERRQKILLELGDVLYYVARISHELDSSLSLVAAMNLEKLRLRQERGLLGGSGSDR